MKKEISPKALITFILGLIWTIYNNYNNGLSGGEQFITFLTNFSVYMVIGILMLVLGGDQSLPSKIWTILKDRSLSPEQKNMKIEFAIIEAVNQWNLNNEALKNAIQPVIQKPQQ